MRKSLLFITFVCFSRSIFSAGTLDTTLSMTDKSRVAETTGGVPWRFGPGEYAKGFIEFPHGIDVNGTGTTDIGINGVIKTPINLNGGTLRLTGDLRLGHLVRINGRGFIDFNGHRITTGDQVQFNAGPVQLFSLGGGGILDGKAGSIVQFFDGSVRIELPANAAPLTLSNIQVINAMDSNFVTSPGSKNLFQNVEFLMSEGAVLNLYGEISTIERGFLRFMGNGSTVIRHGHPTVLFAHQLTGVAQLEIGKGVTYISKELFIATDATAGALGNQTRIILDNATFIKDAHNLVFGSGETIEVLGRSKLGSLNGGSLQLFNQANLRIFPGATLEVDDNFVLRFGAP